MVLEPLWERGSTSGSTDKRDSDQPCQLLVGGPSCKWRAGYFRIVKVRTNPRGSRYLIIKDLGPKSHKNHGL